MSSAAKPSQEALSFRQWRHGDTLEAAMARAEEGVRSRPSDTQARWLLFELLCVTGAWQRALKQLQTCATMNPELDSTAQAMRGLIRAELQRQEVFAGNQKPVPVVDLAPWMQELAQANTFNAQGQNDEADSLRAKALSAAPEVAGEGNLGSFTWLGDTDSRLGPVCEVIAAGSYRWLAFADISRIVIAPPVRLLDLVWASADVTLASGTQLKVYLPVRYPGIAGANDGVRLARETVWREVGETGVFAQGQKTWMTDQGDWPLLEVREIEFNVGPPTQGPDDESAEAAA